MNMITNENNNSAHKKTCVLLFFQIICLLEVKYLIFYKH